MAAGERLQTKLDLSDDMVAQAWGEAARDAKSANCPLAERMIDDVTRDLLAAADRALAK